MEKVSIVMPTYKRRVPMIERAIKSVLNQTYKNIELVIVDDSPKNFPYRQEVKEYISSLNDTRIHYIQNEENLGGALARNVGIFASHGTYISFLDDDDTYLPEKIEKQLNFMLEHNHDMSFSNLIIKNEKEEVIDVREFHDIWSMEGDEFLKYHIMHHATGTPTFMYKKEKLEEIGGFDDAIMGQEFYLMLKTIEAGMDIGYFDSHDVVAYRHSGESISNGMNKIKGQHILQKKKEEYYNLLDNKQKRFVSMRNFAVLAVAYKRNNMYGEAFRNLLAAFFTTPLQFIGASLGFLKNVIKFR